MGHLINPIVYRLGKTKFWNFTWVNKTKKNYKNFLIEDLNFYKFFKWLTNILMWHKIGVFIYDFKIVKKYKSLDFCLFFFLKKLSLFNSYKKFLYKFFLKKSFFKFYYYFLKNKKKRKINFFFLKKDNKKVFNKIKIFKTKNKRFKKKKILKFFLKHNFNSRKKKMKKKKKWLSKYLFGFCPFLLKKKKTYKKKYLKIFNSYFFYKSLIFYFSFLKNSNSIGFKKKFFLLQKNLNFRGFNYNFFFRVLTFFLTFFLKKIFKHKNIIFNFFQKKKIFLNSNLIKKYIRFNLLNTRNKVAQIVKKVFKKTKKKHFILGLKIGFFGRYEKKLRNKKVWQIRGSLSPSNINVPITHNNFCILLKQGLCGVKVSFLSKLKKNEIFKKKTFINKTFEF